jgi:hypothetical protein
MSTSDEKEAATEAATEPGVEGKVAVEGDEGGSQGCFGCTVTFELVT